jgi:RNA polymerase sigma-70 factor (ECF subfamily)
LSESSYHDEAALIGRAKGDAEAFGLLYERYVTKIYNYIYYRVGNERDAEDLTARVFHRAILHLERYTDRGVPFSAWLYKIAHNLVANWHRDEGRRKVVPLHDAVLHGLGPEAPETLTENREEQEVLLRAIRCLPGERQQLLLLKFVERLSNAEIGVVMNRSEGAVKSLYHRTLSTLREELTQEAQSVRGWTPKPERVAYNNRASREKDDLR